MANLDSEKSSGVETQQDNTLGSDSPENQRLLRKVDLRLLPILTLLYLLSFLDRWAFSGLLKVLSLNICAGQILRMPSDYIYIDHLR